MTKGVAHLSNIRTTACLIFILLSGAALQSLGAFHHIHAQQFSSAYTDLNKECRNAVKKVGEGQDMPLRCKGYGGYYIYIYYSAFASHTAAVTRDEQTSLPLATQSLGYSDEKGRKIEWRMAGGQPFAVILRVSLYKEGAGDGGESPFQDKYKTGEALLVKGLKGYEHIDFEVDGKTPDANAKAREMADRAYAQGRAGSGAN